MNSIKDFGDFLEKLMMGMKREFYSHAPYDKTYKGRITENVMSKLDKTKKTNRYKVLINGVTHVVSSSIECEIGDFVWVTIPCGNINNAFVACKTK